MSARLGSTKCRDNVVVLIDDLGGMMDENFDEEPLSDLRPDRRSFVKGVVATTAFAAPFVASFDLQSLSDSVAHAQVNSS